MANSIYTINKGVSRSIEFKGFRAQYIAYLAAGLVIALIVFAVLYICKVPVPACLLFIITAIVILFTRIAALSKKYGEHGLMKKQARRSVPKVIHFHSRLFTHKANA